jgi:hypothetical protein
LYVEFIVDILEKKNRGITERLAIDPNELSHTVFEDPNNMISGLDSVKGANPEAGQSTQKSR